MTIKIMQEMAGASKNHKVNYKPRTVPKHPEEIQRLILPFIETCKISLNAIDAYAPIPPACDLLEFTEIGITLLLKYFAQLINIGRININ